MAHGVLGAERDFVAEVLGPMLDRLANEAKEEAAADAMAIVVEVKRELDIVAIEHGVYPWSPITGVHAPGFLIKRGGVAEWWNNRVRVE